jgi:hypothetical protein
MGFLRKRWPFLLILFAALIALAPALRPGAAIGPWDDLRAMMDGKPTPRAFDVLQMDAVLQFYGWRDLVFESWGRFEPPYWNPYQLMGTPLLANSQSGGFYPLHILMGVLHVPTALAILLLAWFHLCVAGFGVRALVLRIGGSEIGAAVGGAMFAVSPFMLSWVGLASVVTTCAWIPWALVFCHDMFDDERRSMRSFALLSISLGMMVLGGHLQFAAYGFMAVAALAATQASALRKPKAIASVLGAGAFGLCLAAPQLFPVLEYSKFSHRQNDPTEGGYAFYQRGAVSPVEAAGIAFPDLLGTPGRAADVDTDVPITSFWPAFTKIGGNYAESAVFLGPAALLLLVLAAFRRGWRAASAVAAVGVLGLLLAFGTPLNKLLYFYLPGWSSTGSPGRASVLFVIAACAVAGWAWPREGESPKMKAPAYVFIALLLGALTAVAVMKANVVAWNPNLQAVLEETVHGNIAFTLLIALVSTLLAAGALAAALKGRPIVGGALAVLATVVIAGPRLVPAGTPLERGTPDPNMRYAFVNADWQLLIGLPVVHPPNTATIERKLDVAGYDSLIHSETFAILNEINGRDSAPEANGNMTLIKPGYSLTVLQEAGVTAIEGSGADFAKAVGYSGNRAIVVRSVPMGDGTQPVTFRAEVLSDSLIQTTLVAEGPGRLTLRDRNMPGWTATVDGQPAEIKGTRWRELELPEGEHTVVFKYTPSGLRLGLILFGISAIVTVAGLLFHRFKKPR